MNARWSEASPSGSSPASNAAATRRASASCSTLRPVPRVDLGTQRGVVVEQHLLGIAGVGVDGVDHQVRTPERRRATAAVQRVGAQHRVADGG